MLRHILDLLFPPRCLVCGLPDPEILCGYCRRGFQVVPPPICLRCGSPLAATGAADRCPRCRRGTIPFAAARAPALYAGSLRTALHRLKFNGRRALGPLLGEFLAEFVRATAALGHPDLVVPVPLHPSRERARGFNHAALLAAPVAETLGLPMDAALLERVTPTAPQRTLTGPERRANVRGAFRVRASAAAIVRGQALLLVDDVLTSGATAAECTRTLLAAGAAEVRVATVARAVLTTDGPGAEGEAGSPARGHEGHL